ncbi:MAG: membrane protein insertion efficiency factor YidD [Planctomycetaceae bacterium]|nr:MAG: membrane protein insertion efficiency factor YidD [Planctomycetaceae bacterium]
MTNRLIKLPGDMLIFLARLYQATLSRYLGGQCRFVPSCSNYFIEAVQKKGVIRGGAMGIWRILRCHPLSKGGYDPADQQRTTAADYFRAHHVRIFDVHYENTICVSLRIDAISGVTTAPNGKPLPTIAKHRTDWLLACRSALLLLLLPFLCCF